MLVVVVVVLVKAVVISCTLFSIPCLFFFVSPAAGSNALNHRYGAPGVLAVDPGGGIKIKEHFSCGMFTVTVPLLILQLKDSSARQSHRFGFLVYMYHSGPLWCQATIPAL